MMVVAIFAAVLWLVCSMIYSGALFYERRVAKRDQASEGEEEGSSDSRDGVKDSSSPRTRTPTSEVDLA